MASLNIVQVEKEIRKWIAIWEKGCFSSEDIQKEWENWIPEIADQLGEITNSVDTELEKCQFIEDFITVLDKFVFYGYSTDRIDQEESTTCNSTSTLNNSLCYFKCEECEEKGVYRTLCAECFANSEHRGHNYIRFWSPSGYCCCGESGTWEKAWFCKKHLDFSRGNGCSLPEDVENRAGMVIEAILSYIDDLLNCYQKIDRHIFCNESVLYVTLYCAEDYQNVPDDDDNVMAKVLMASGVHFVDFYHRMCRDGRITVKVFETHFKAIMASCNGKHPNVRVFRINELIHQNFLFRVLGYLRRCLNYGRGLRRTFSKLMMTSVPTLNGISRTEHFLGLSKMLPKGFRVTINELLVFGMMKEYESKESLGKMIVERYDVIMKMNYIWEMEFHHRLFTIPKLAQRLIINENILGVILKEFLKDCNEMRRWEDHGEYNLAAFKRSLKHLDMVKCLLRTAPTIWIRNLRVGFLSGLRCFLHVIDSFQNIDSETRRTGDHVQYEIDVRLVDKVASRLAQCASLFLKWCKSDNEILRMACEETMKMIDQRICFEPDGTEKTVDVSTHSAKCLPYDSTIHPVSVHLPLFRFLVSLCGVRLGHCDETLLDLLKTTVVSKIFDSVLKIQAMLAQVTAGMWKRNGDPAAIRSVSYRYRNTVEIFDRDIQLLQIVASVTESNKFLIQILEKYCLIDWINPSFEEDLKKLEKEEIHQVVVISEEFLRLLIMVLIERHVPYVSDADVVDNLKYNIIHSLCIQPCPRSQLEDFLENDYTTEAVMNSAIEEMAVLKEPTSNSENGNYELRQKVLDRYNPLYYHYNPMEMREANEYQSRQRKAAGKPDCFPPSELPKLKQFFVPMVDIFQCDVMFHIIRTVAERFLDLESKSSSKTQLQYVLYLIGYALREEQSGRYSTLSFTERAANWNILGCLERLSTSTRDDLPKDLLRWTIEKYREVARTTTPNEVTINRNKETEKEKRSQLASAKRAKIMQEMLERQKKFLKKNSSAYKEKKTEDIVLNTKECSIKTEETCILCQETQNLESTNRVMVMAGYVQYSTVLCARRENVNADFQIPLLTSNIGPAFYTSSCGHPMHAECLKSYRRTISRNEVADTFLCPLCSSISNVALPLLPHIYQLHNNPIRVSKNLSEALVDFAGKYYKSPKSSKHPLHLWKSLSYTIHVIEKLLRHSNKPILGCLSSHHRECLDYFILIAAVVKHVHPNDDSYAVLIKNFLRGHHGKPNMLLNYDLFGLVVTVTFARITVFSKGDTYKTVRLLFVAQIIKILIQTNFDEMIDDVKSEDVTPFKLILQLFGKNQNFTHLSETFIWKYVQKASLPFLRRCVLLFSFLNDVPPPVELTQVGGDTFANMCSYLKFPQTRERVFDVIHAYPYVKSWVHHPSVTDYLKSRGQTFETIDPHHINQLIKLPLEYFEIVRKTVSLKCPNSNNQEVNNPHVCLVCGEIICTRICCCKLVNGCFNQSLKLHTKECGGGMYLKVDTGEIVFQQRKNMSEDFCVPGPYLDEYYESGVKFNTGNPLYLSLDKYNQLHTLWLSHGIFEKISRLSMEEHDSDDDDLIFR